jgi:hypothetical protein
MSNSRYTTICLGGLYLKQGKKGTYLTGKLNHNRLMIFPNDSKKESNDPDYKMFLTVEKGGKKKES